jgi:hypothetical protein
MITSNHSIYRYITRFLNKTISENSIGHFSTYCQPGRGGPFVCRIAYRRIMEVEEAVNQNMGGDGLYRIPNTDVFVAVSNEVALTVYTIKNTDRDYLILPTREEELKEEYECPFFNSKSINIKKHEEYSTQRKLRRKKTPSHNRPSINSTMKTKNITPEFKESLNAVQIEINRKNRKLRNLEKQNIRRAERMLDK